jgi:hypothetical protein
MKDAFGQERTPVQRRETVIAALFAVIVGVAIWSVAIPALDEHHEEKDASGPVKPSDGEKAEPSPEPSAKP